MTFKSVSTPTPAAAPTAPVAANARSHSGPDRARVSALGAPSSGPGLEVPGDSAPPDLLQRAVRLGHRIDRVNVTGPASSEAVFRAIAAAPTAEAGAEFFAHDECEYPNLGFTTRIFGHSGPEIEHNAEQGPGGWVAKPTLTASEEGDNDSWALAEGTHAIPDEQLEENDDKPLFARVSAAMAIQVAAAEEEHNADYRYAAREILEKADDWLDDYMHASYGPAGSKAGAEALVDAHVNPGLKAELGLTAYDGFEWSDVGFAYRKAADMTRGRDDNLWHSFDNDTVVEGEGADRRVVDVIKAGNTQIGNHPPSDVVKVDEVEP